MNDSTSDDFVTVAITWSQPEAGVMLAMFEFYGIPSYGVGRWHAAIDPSAMVALQGIAVRVAVNSQVEALDLLAQAAHTAPVIRPYALGSAYRYRAAIILALVLPAIAFILLPFEIALIAATPALLLFVAPPPTRASAYLACNKKIFRQNKQTN